jgi:hypothetical protein
MNVKEYDVWFELLIGDTLYTMETCADYDTREEAWRAGHVVLAFDPLMCVDVRRRYGNASPSQ